MKRLCGWSEAGDSTGIYDDTWTTDCGNEFILNEMTTPTECGFKFCPFCGAELVETTEDDH